MNIIITGMNGTVAPIVADYFKERGHNIIKWDRNKISAYDYEMMKQFILLSKVEFVFHFAMGSPIWAKRMAEICKEHGIGFLYISTVNVFSEKGSGPYDINSIPNAEEEYGSYKLQCERVVSEVNNNAYIIRLGWQIGTRSGSNNMIDFLTKQMDEKGVIEASSKWLPSCSFISDTAKGIYQIITALPPDLYLLNSNQEFSFFEIVSKLSEEHQEFKVKEVTAFIRDDRMFDERVIVKWKL